MLYVITTHFNPWKYNSRNNLHREFDKYVQAFNDVKLITVELAFGDRPFLFTERDDLYDVQLRSSYEMWHKERMLNLGIQYLSQLDPDWKYVAWIDSDVQFARPDWVQKTQDLLQHYEIIQMFSQCMDMSPTYELYKSHAQGIIYAYQNGILDCENYEKYSLYSHPGFAWAARRSALDKLGGLLDIAILGSADWHMARALVGLDVRNKNVSPKYLEHLTRWKNRADTYIRGNVGYLEGLLCHYFHGNKKNRKYNDRWKILIDNKYDPDEDIKVDTQGLYKYSHDNSKLEQEIRKYFRSRNEDEYVLC